MCCLLIVVVVVVGDRHLNALDDVKDAYVGASEDDDDDAVVPY